MNSALTKMAIHLHQRLGRYLDRRGRGQYDAPPERALERPTGGPQYYAFGRAGRSDREEALSDLLAGLGHQNPVEQLFMLEGFLSTEEHLTARTFSELLKDRGHDISTEMASGTLELFTSLGFAEKHFAEDGRVLYEHKRPGLHHDHLICSSCGQTTEFNRPDVDGLIEKIACDENYCHLNHRLVIYGLCPECRLRRRDGLPLSETTAGETVVGTTFEGPEAIKDRLADMGIRRGTCLKILGEQSGSMIVQARGCRLAMGPELSSGIMVRARGRGPCGPTLPMAGRKRH